MKLNVLKSFLLCLTSIACAASSPFVGTYESDDIVLSIEEGTGDQFSGVISIYDESVAFACREEEGALVGTLILDDESIPFRMTLKGSTLMFTADGETQMLIRQSPESAKVGTMAHGRMPADTASPLRVNGVMIGEEKVHRLEQEMRMQIPRGDFWYDKVSGAWGIIGGPTLGFTIPGMDLGGPLKADASSGNTGVFINGRQLQMQDVAGLQSLGVPVQQGRWWVDHQGNFGVEGNAIAIGNLFQFSRGKGGTYQRATAGGYIGSDGTTSYFFDPKTGSSVITGP
jgi:hypothetical protein